MLIMVFLEHPEQKWTRHDRTGIHVELRWYTLRVFLKISKLNNISKNPKSIIYYKETSSESKISSHNFLYTLCSAFRMSFQQTQPLVGKHKLSTFSAEREHFSECKDTKVKLIRYNDSYYVLKKSLYHLISYYANNQYKSTRKYFGGGKAQVPSGHLLALRDSWLQGLGERWLWDLCGATSWVYSAAYTHR